MTAKGDDTIPNYDYHCEACNHVFEESRRISERNIPEGAPCPHCGVTGQVQITIGAPPMGDAVRMGFVRPSDGFREVLHKIHERMPGSKLKDNARHF